MSPFLGELVGTAILLLLGDGVVANVVLRGTKGEGAGWIVITLGWAMAVFCAVSVSALASGAHLNPAVTIGLAAAGKFDWVEVPWYILAQLLGAALGALLVWLHYRPHFGVTPEPGPKLAVFATGPAIRSAADNLVSEAIGTFVLVFAALALSDRGGELGPLDALPIALVILVIGLALGGTTGYAINPARDLSPRLIHALLPIPGKGPSDWSYAWIPILGPVLGGLLAALAWRALTAAPTITAFGG